MHQIISTKAAPAAIGPYSQAVKCMSFVYTSGQIGLDPATGELKEGIRAQTEQVFDNLRAVLAESGARFADVLRFTVYVTDLKNFALVNEIMASRIAQPYPARSCVEVKALPKGALVEIEATAYADVGLTPHLEI